MNLPQGVIADPRATEARCTEAELESREGSAGCPNAAAVGVFSVYLDGIEVLDEPVYNMAPPAGVPAELGFDAAGIGLIMHVGGRVRNADYGMSADISDIPEEHPIYGIELTLWGDPSAASHDQERGLCADEKAKQSIQENRHPQQLPGGKDRQSISDAADLVHGPTADNDDERRLLAGTGCARRTATGTIPRRDGLRKARVQPNAGRAAGAGSRGGGIADGAGRRPESAARRKRGQGSPRRT